ncbi:MAG TPA: ABC transporter permease, partial [Candidatus Hydrogenedentes bacterium]|nr:ABC transporter permease [Candidatus Hydrogenedentota bacterium]
MTMLRLVLDGLRFHWRMHLGAAIGTALAAAILTGALLVGDSTDYSLRQYASARLGSIHYAIESRGGFFSQDLVNVLEEVVGAPMVPALTLRGMALPTDTAAGSQINQVSVIGTTAAFWDFDPEAEAALEGYETALNERLAQALGVGAGDQIALRISKPGILPRDAPLSSRAEDTSVRVMCTVTAVLPDTGLGRFSLTASQAAPYNAFVNSEWLQEQTELEGRVDTVLVGEGTTHEDLDKALGEEWRLEHTGLRLHSHPSGVLQLETDRIFLHSAVAEAALTLPDAQGTLSYLVNSISKDDLFTPYSFATGGPVPPDMPDDEVVINRWLADEIQAEPGDSVEVRYYELTPANEFVEKERTFTVHGIAEMDELEAERELVPEFPGLTDVERCADWDIGMPLDDEYLADEANEDYWNLYGPTPKLLCTLAAAQEMWANRFGDLMTVRFPSDTTSASEVRDALHRHVAPADVGLLAVPVREQAFEAVETALDLGGLFLGMSFFLIVAALVLTALLFVFGVQRRASEMGALLALGFRPRHIRALFLAEAASSAIV